VRWSGVRSVQISVIGSDWFCGISKLSDVGA